MSTMTIPITPTPPAAIAIEGSTSTTVDPVSAETSPSREL